MKAESHPFQCLPLKNRYPGSQPPELCVQWLYYNHYKCASFLCPRPTLLTSHKTPKGGAWLGLAGCPSEWKDLWNLHHPVADVPPQKPTLAERVHFTNRVRQVEPKWGNQDGGCGVRQEAVYYMYSLGLYGLHLKPGSAQALILENRTNSLITPQNPTHLFGGKFQI